MSNNSLEKITILSVLVMLLGIYGLSAGKVPTGYADSDELITAGFFRTVAHPPGYGINVYLINCFQHLLSFLNPAHASNLLAGILHALAISILVSTAINILKYRGICNSSSLIGCGVGGIVSGLVGIFWLYASVIEVMSLGNLFVAVILFLSTKWYFSNTQNTKLFFTIPIIFGLGISHLHSIILLAPGLLFLLLSKKWSENSFTKKISLTGISTVITLSFFFVGSLTIIPLNKPSEVSSWQFSNTIAGWWRMISRSDYQGFSPERNITYSNAYLYDVSLTKITYLPQYLRSVFNHYAGTGIILVVIGLYFFLKSDKKYVFSIILMYCFAGILLGIYVIPKTDPANLEYKLLMGASERQFLLGFTLLSLFTIIGSSHLLNQIVQIFHKSIYKTVVTFLYVAILPLGMLIANKSIGDQSKEVFAYQYATDLLSSAKPNGVIICSSDISCFSLLYKNLVEKYRPDVTVLTKNPRSRQYFLEENMDYVGYLYKDNPQFFAQQIAWNVTRRPTYLTSIDSFYSTYVGFERNPFSIVPQDRLFQVLKTPPMDSLSQASDPNTLTMINYQADNRDYYKNGFKDYFLSILLLQAQLYTRQGFPNQATTPLDTILALNPGFPEILNWRIRITELSQSTKYQTSQLNTAQKYLDASKKLANNQDMSLAYEYARKAYYLDPSSKETISFLIELYELGNYPEYADIERKHLLSL